ncbi:MAG TPA: alpha/beta hydrolase [Acidimicrobiales bacterium]|nr:alpha/beta hydrolase [Acidimicrobiales bacterium]
MPLATVQGLSIGYDIIGDGGLSWVITPGGRFSRQVPGVPELASALAQRGNRVLTWDRPNTGESDVCFDGTSESTMQADVLAGLLSDLDMVPAVLVGGSGGARVSLLTAARHPGIATGIAVLWLSGGVYGLMTLGTYYCGGSIEAAWRGGMEAVCALPEWQEVLSRNPANHQRFLDQDPRRFIAALERWMATYCSCGGALVPDLPDAQARDLDIPALVFRSGTTDLHHRREATDRLAQLLPNARLVDPPWGDNEWNERQDARMGNRREGLFVRWPLLAPALTEWAQKSLGPAWS